MKLRNLGKTDCQNNFACCKPFFDVPEQNYISPVLSGFVIDDNVFAICVFIGKNNRYYELVSSYTPS